MPEQDRGAERIAMHAEDQLRSAHDHLLHQKAFWPHAALRHDLLAHRQQALANRLDIEIDRYASHVALVGDVS
jgi:hypothetical protein